MFTNKGWTKILMCPLTDKKISIDAFLIKDIKCPDSIQVCHNEAVSKEKYTLTKHVVTL